MMLGKVFWWLLKAICYVALVVVAAGAISLFVPPWLELCSPLGGGTVKCTEPFYRSVYEFGFTVVMLTVFTGLPGLLALGGVVFLIRDVFWRRRVAR